MLLLISLALVACEAPDMGGSSSGGGSSNAGGSTGGGTGGGSEYIDNAISMQTLTYFSRELGGFQNAADEYYCGENIYMYVKLSAKNRSQSYQNVSMTITMENAEYLHVENESTGNVQPNIKKIDSLGNYVISITGISFTVEPGDTKEREYIFLVRPTKECEGNITVEYHGSIVDDESVSYKRYSFKGRENLEQISAPTITPREEGFVWTDSPITNIDQKLYVVQIWNTNGDMLWTAGPGYTKNYLNISDITPSLTTGQYKLTVKTLGDGISTKDSETQEFVFSVTDPINVSYENGIITWDAVEGAIKYKVSFGSYSEYVAENEFNMYKYDGTAGAVQISVLPVFADSSILSPPSNVIPLTVTDGPVVTVSGAYASWSANGATLFDIYINGEYCETITETKYRRQQGEGVLLTIVARNDDGTTISKHSEPVDISSD